MNYLSDYTFEGTLRMKKDQSLVPGQSSLTWLDQQKIIYSYLQPHYEEYQTDGTTAHAFKPGLFVILLTAE